MGRYEENFLPGCSGSVVVVQLKWSICPAGDYNCFKRKDSYPSVAFDVITGYDQQVLRVSSMHFGTQNNKQIVLTDKMMSSITNEWYRNVGWVYFGGFGIEQFDYGVYLICDGWYLQRPQLICLYKHKPVRSWEGYFSPKIESIWKDVECVFGILKKQWKILDYWICLWDISVVEKCSLAVACFTTLCCLKWNLESWMSGWGMVDLLKEIGCGWEVMRDNLRWTTIVC